MKKIRHIDGFDMKNTFAGVAVSVWFQGCTHRCKGCFNPETWKLTDSELTDKELAEFDEKMKAESIHKDVSYLGGDPFQPTNRDSLLRFMKHVKENYPDSKQFAWTGYQFEVLYDLQLPHLDYLEVLVDGQFKETLKVDGKKYGSSNQRVWIKENGVWKISDKH